jgi:hypothetical protein
MLAATILVVQNMSERLLRLLLRQDYYTELWCVHFARITGKSGLIDLCKPGPSTLNSGDQWLPAWVSVHRLAQRASCTIVSRDWQWPRSFNRWLVVDTSIEIRHRLTCKSACVHVLPHLRVSNHVYLALRRLHKLYIYNNLPRLHRKQPLWCSGYHVPFTTRSSSKMMNGNPCG